MSVIISTSGDVPCRRADESDGERQGVTLGCGLHRRALDTAVHRGYRRCAASGLSRSSPRRGARQHLLEHLNRLPHFLHRAQRDPRVGVSKGGKSRRTCTLSAAQASRNTFAGRLSSTEMQFVWRSAASYPRSRNACNVKSRTRAFSARSSSMCCGSLSDAIPAAAVSVLHAAEAPRIARSRGPSRPDRSRSRVEDQPSRGPSRTTG